MSRNDLKVSILIVFFFCRWTSEGFVCLFLLNRHYLWFSFLPFYATRCGNLCFFHSFSGHTSAVVVRCFPAPLKFYPFVVSYRKYISVYIIRGKKGKSLPKVVKALLLPLPLGLSVSVKKGDGCFTPDTSICVKIMSVGKDRLNILTCKWGVEFSSKSWNKNILYLKCFEVNVYAWKLLNWKKKANKKNFTKKSQLFHLMAHKIWKKSFKGFFIGR